MGGHMFDPPDAAERERLRLIEQKIQQRIRLRLATGLASGGPSEGGRWSPTVVAFIILAIRAAIGGIMIGLFGWGILPFVIVLYVFEKVVGPTESMVDARLRRERDRRRA